MVFSVFVLMNKKGVHLAMRPLAEGLLLLAASATLGLLVWHGTHLLCD